MLFNGMLVQGFKLADFLLPDQFHHHKANNIKSLKCMSAMGRVSIHLDVVLHAELEEFRGVV